MPVGKCATTVVAREETYHRCGGEEGWRGVNFISLATFHSDSASRYE
jgi:hypothetical protein